MATDPSAMANMLPGVDPDDWMQAQRAQLVAQMAIQGSQQPIQPQNFGRMASRTSILSPIVRMAQAYMGRQALDQYTQLSGKTMAQAMRAFDPNNPYGASASSASSTSAALPDDAPPNASPPSNSTTTSGQVSPPGIGSSPPITPQAAASTATATLQAAGHHINPWNPMGVPAQVAMRAYQSNPADYMKSIMGTPEWQNALRATGGDQNAAAQLMHAHAMKEGTIDARPGGASYLPDGRVLRNPQLSAGEVPVYDDSGNLIGSRLLPGHAAAQGAITGAETAAREANTPREIPMGGGVERFAYPGDVSSVGTPPALRSQASDVLPIMDQSGQIVGYRQRPSGGGQTPGAGAGAQSGGASTPPQRQYFPPLSSVVGPPPSVPGSAPGAHQSSSQASGPWANVPRMSLPSTPGQTTDAFHQKILTDAAAKHVELQNKLADDATLADQKQQYNAQALQALPKAEVGPLSDWLTTNRQRLVEAGVPANMIPESGSVTPTLELNKYLKNTALQGARQIYGSRMTQTEVKLQTDEMSPSAHMTADAIASLLQQDQIRNGYAKQRAQDYQRYFQQGGDPLQFESWYSRNRPLTRYSAQFTTPPAALERLQQNPHTLPDFKAKYGWDPNQ